MGPSSFNRTTRGSSPSGASSAWHRVIASTRFHRRPRTCVNGPRPRPRNALPEGELLMNGTDFPTHVSDALLPGGLETFQLRMKRPVDHGQIATAQVRAVDLAHANAVGRRYCAINKFTFVTVLVLCVADPSILDEPAPH